MFKMKFIIGVYKQYLVSYFCPTINFENLIEIQSLFIYLLQSRFTVYIFNQINRLLNIDDFKNIAEMTTLGNIEMMSLCKPLNVTSDINLSISPANQSNNSTSDEVMAPIQDQLILRPSIRGPYRPVRNGTINGSIFAMLASALGTRCLNLPIRVFQLGIFPFIIVVLITAYLAFCGMYLMERVIVKYKVISYSQMVKRAFGVTAMKYADIVLIIYPWALSICLQVILANFMVQIITDFTGLSLYDDREKEIYSNLGNIVRIIVAILNVLLNGRHFFQTDLHEMLQSLGKFSVTGVIVCMCCLIFTAFVGFSKQVNDNVVEYKSVFTMDYQYVEFFKPLNSHYIVVLLQCISGIFFPFLNHQFIFPLLSLLKKPTKNRVKRIFIWTHLYQIVIYLTIALVGYLLLSQHLNQIPISPLVITSIPTLPLMLGKIMIVGSIFFNIPLQIFTTRQYLYQVLDIDRNSQNLLKLNVVLIGSSFFIPLIFQEVNMYFGLIGGTAGVLMAGIIPLLCMRKLCSIYSQDITIMIFVGVMCIICFIGAITSVINPI